MSTKVVIIKDHYTVAKVDTTQQRIAINNNEYVSVKIGSVAGIQGIQGEVGPSGSQGIPGAAGTGSFSTGSLATTGSNVFKENQIISGSLTVFTSSLENSANLIAAWAPNIANGLNVSYGIGLAFQSGSSVFLGFVNQTSSITSSFGFIETWGGTNPIRVKANNWTVNTSGQAAFGKATASATLDVLGTALITGSLIVSGSSFLSGSFTGSLQGTSSFAISTSQAAFSVTASHALNSTPIATGSFATTGSNVFTGSQIISGSLQADNTSITGSLNISGSDGTLFVINQGIGTSPVLFVSRSGAIGMGVIPTGSVKLHVGGRIKFSVPQLDNIILFEDSIDKYAIGGASNEIRIGAPSYSTAAVTIGSYEESVAKTWSEKMRISTATGFVSINKTTANAMLDISGSVAITGSLIVTGSSFLSGSFTGSIQGTASFAISTSQAFMAVTASYALNSTSITTGSFATTGSNVFIGNQTITGSFIVTGSSFLSGSFTGSLQGTASYAISTSRAVSSSYSDVAGTLLGSVVSASRAISSSWADSASNAVYAISASWAPAGNVDTTIFATTGSNIFVGNQTITGSVTISGSINIVNPFNTVELFDDFVGNGNATSQIGSLGWRLTTGASYTGVQPSVVGEFGIGRCSCVAAAGSASALLLNTGGSIQSFLSSTPNAQYISRFRNFSSASSDSASLRIGISSQVGAGNGNGIYFRATGSGNWTCVTRTGATELSSSTSFTQSLTFQKFEILTDSTGLTASFKINDTLVAVHSGSSYPVSTGVSYGMYVETYNAVARGFEVDYFYQRVTDLNR